MILSSGVVDKDGEIYVARQFIEMARSKVEALYLGFSRLVRRSAQRTVIQADEVRYIYQAVNDFYCVLITDKDSNILEDVKTLKVFVGAINEFAPVTEEKLLQSRFELLLMFDEIVNMGNRQIDDLMQLRTIMSMESEEEKAFMDSRTKKEREAKAKAAEKAKDIDQQRKNEMLHRRPTRGATTGNLNAISSSTKIQDPVVEVEHKPSKPSRVMSRGKALKLSRFNDSARS